MLPLMKTRYDFSRRGARASWASSIQTLSAALMRPGDHPLDALRQAVEAAPAHGRLVIAVDQFEELFTACSDDAERTGFADALVATTTLAFAAGELLSAKAVPQSP